MLVMDPPHNGLCRRDVTRLPELISFLPDSIFTALGQSWAVGGREGERWGGGRCYIYLKPAHALLLSNNSTQLPISPPHTHTHTLLPPLRFIRLLICGRQIINLAKLFIPRVIFPYLCLGGGGEDDAIEMSSRSQRRAIKGAPRARAVWGKNGGRQRGLLRDSCRRITNAPVTF